MNLLEKINKDYQESLLKKETKKIPTLKLLRAAIQNLTIELRARKKELKEEEIIQALQREIKKRKEAIVLYERGGRPDLVLKEKEEIEILSAYLPPALSESEIKKIIQQKIKELSPEKNFGKIMKEVMKEVAGRVEGTKVAALVKEELNQSE
ncbi:MAG: GatB/YqeY domain-containing protein [Patescibacteria group bacterium]|nr:GatB/YqeY domain-containing protein [Patescibacteria group bacterium]